MIIIMNSKPLRTTRQRRLTLEELRRVPCHPTADELYERLRKQMPRISLGTVYRNLEIFCRAGQARKLESGSHQARYDGTLSPHAHVRCIRCGKAADVQASPLPDAVSQAKAMEGYKILDYRLEFTGLCPTCQKQHE